MNSKLILAYKYVIKSILQSFFWDGKSLRYIRIVYCDCVILIFFKYINGKNASPRGNCFTHSYSMSGTISGTCWSLFDLYSNQLWLNKTILIQFPVIKRLLKVLIPWTLTNCRIVLSSTRILSKILSFVVNLFHLKNKC